MKRTSPPVGVQARPVATPGTLVRRRCSAKRGGGRAARGRVWPRPSTLPGLALGDFAGDFAADRADLPLEVAHAGLARVLLDDRDQGGVGELDLRGLQPIGGDLARHQVATRDVALLLQRVARQLDRLHAVLQGPRDRVEHVGRCDEEDLGEVELEVEVVVAEGIVLRRVEHLEHRQGGELASAVVGCAFTRAAAAAAATAAAALTRSEPGGRRERDLAVGIDVLDEDLDLVAEARRRPRPGRCACHRRASRCGSGRPDRKMSTNAPELGRC